MGHRFFWNNEDPKHVKVFKIIGMTIGGIILAVLFALIFGYVVMLLWNWLMPAIFNLPLISYWQAFGIVILAKILFSGFGKHCHDNKNAHFNKMHDKFHKSSGIECCEDIKHYKDFWEEEGKKAFEEYLNREKKE